MKNFSKNCYWNYPMIPIWTSSIILSEIYAWVLFKVFLKILPRISLVISQIILSGTAFREPPGTPSKYFRKSSNNCFCNLIRRFAQELLQLSPQKFLQEFCQNILQRLFKKFVQQFHQALRYEFLKKFLQIFITDLLQGYLQRLN